MGRGSSSDCRASSPTSHNHVSKHPGKYAVTETETGRGETVKDICQEKSTLTRGRPFIRCSFISLLPKLVPKHFMELWPHGGSKTPDLTEKLIHQKCRPVIIRSIVSSSGYLEFVWYHLHQTPARFVLPGSSCQDDTHLLKDIIIHSICTEAKAIKHMGAATLHRWGHFQLEFVQVWSCGATELILGSCSHQLNYNLSE